MSLVPDNRKISTSIEYSPVGNERDHEYLEISLSSASSNHDNGTKPVRTGSGHFDNASSSNRDSTTTRVDQIEVSRSGQNTAGHKGPSIAGWPAAPQKLSNFSISLFFGDILLVFLPIAFLVLGISAWTLNGKELSEAGSIVEGAMNLGPTIYPLAFAAIGSRCLRNIAVYLAERGTTIATLEKLLGSQSLVSAIGTAFTLRSYSLLSLAVLLLWVLSPLGGQSSLRLLHQTNSTILEPGTVYYSDHDAPINPYEVSRWLALVPAVLSASLASSKEAKELPVDLWAHPKVPRLDVVEEMAKSSSMSASDWIALNTSGPQKYSSWTGINIQGLNKARSADFDTKYNYLYVDCEVLSRGESENVWQDLKAANLSFYPTVNYTAPERTMTTHYGLMTSYYGLMKGVLFENLSMFLKLAHPSNSTDKFSNDTRAGFETKNQSIKFLYGASYSKRDQASHGPGVVIVHTCTPYMVTLDARFRCHGGDCVATHLRYLPGPSRSTLATSCASETKLGCWAFGTRGLYDLMIYFPKALDLPLTEGLTNPYDDWMAGGNITFRGQTRPGEDDDRSVDNVYDNIISERLTILINTFYQAVAWGPQITRAGFFEVPRYGLETQDQPPVAYFTPEQWLNATEAVFSVSVPTYKADVGWIVSLLLISTILFLLGIFNIIVSFLTVAPDLFYYASSLARENPYTDTPDGGTALNGAERSRLLRSMKVQIADASPENKVGYVVLKSVGDDDDFSTGRLNKDRLYW